jgi:DNA-binding NarL/FixJ family response regulator
MSGERTESFDRVAGLLLGADDYMVKPFAIDELIARVRRLTRRIPALPRSVAAKLTARELEVLRLLATGMSPVEIADELGVSPKTVRTHSEHIFLKLGAQSRAQVVAIAYRDNLLEPLTPAGATVRAAEPSDGEARRALSSSRDGA